MIRKALSGGLLLLAVFAAGATGTTGCASDEPEDCMHTSDLVAQEDGSCGIKDYCADVSCDAPNSECVGYAAGFACECIAGYVPDACTGQCTLEAEANQDGCGGGGGAGGASATGGSSAGGSAPGGAGGGGGA